ncbi:FecR family protein [Sphingobacterium tabacisoli]|uniref:FecR family protein n=1 Tax=Sphingobacterium tabacisoli TaxID=2044855 RepID=A0ABW5L5Q3_9SPHI|nr:FecR domain-containing protein [Sphingobacterium tabacisoli]
MDQDRFRQLLQKYADGEELSTEEELLLSQAYDQALDEEMDAVNSDVSLGPADYIGDNLRERIQQQIETKTKRPFRFQKLQYVAAVLLFGFVGFAGAYWYLGSPITKDKELAVTNDILPGENRAMLTLSDGSLIALNDVEDGTIATQDGVRIDKDADGKLIYKVGEQKQELSHRLNTISTPKGSRYQIILPDGSTALLNAESSLTYPVCFSEKERRVEMTGEVYFEIKKIVASKGTGNKPFFVKTATQEVQVLGTHFNINAYTDESVVRTTLVEGQVKVNSKDGRSALLKPGQQTVLGQSLEVREADIQEQLSWTNGDFVFRGATLESLLRQVSRWYDVEVDYPPHLAKIRFTGMVSRSQPLSVIAKMIQSTKKAKVTIKERRFVVTD